MPKKSCKYLTVKDLLELILYLNNSQKVKKKLETKRDEELVDYLYEISKKFLEENETKDKPTEKFLGLTNNKNSSLEDRPKDKDRDTISSRTESGSRSQIEKNKAVEKANYKCELDESHSFFISRMTNKNYVEGHHLIPLEFKDDFGYSLDVGALMGCLFIDQFVWIRFIITIIKF